jgi:serine/threonine-protein kinase
MAFGPLDDQVDDLLARWEELREQGRTVFAETLCADCPELADGLARRIQALIEMDRLFSPGAPGAARESGMGLRLSATSAVRYGNLRFHADGGLGEVFTAEGDDLKRKVALKFIKRPRAADPESRRRFLFEAEVTGRLEHPGVVSVYGLGTDDRGYPCYAMRLVRGQTLQDALSTFHGAAPDGQDLQERPRVLRELLRRFISICNTVGYAHSRGILHRDLKPKNVMIGPFNETLVVDWGLAKPYGAARAAGDGEDLLVLSDGDEAIQLTAGPVGTPGYLSPEQARNEPSSPASDIYSLGATLYALLTGRPPVEGANAAEVLERTRRNEHPAARAVNPAVHPALEAVCSKAMATRPEDRYPNPLSLAADIEHWLADEPVSAWRDPLLERVRRWARRHRTMVTASVVALLVALAGLSAVLVGQSRANHTLRLSRDAERKAREMADSQTALAMEAVRDYYTGVSEDVLLKQSALTELRTKLLRRPQQFYLQLKASLESGQREEPVTLARLAAADFNLGKLTADIGSREDAIAAHLQALEIRQALLNDYPGVADFRSALAESHHHLGTLYYAVGRASDAESAWQEAARLLKALADDHPDVIRYRADLTKSQNNLGIAYHASGHMDRAESAWTEARDVLRGLAAAHPDSDEYQGTLGKTQINLGTLYGATGRPALAEAAYGDAVAILSSLAHAHPDVADYRVDRAMAQNNLAYLDYSARRFDRAESGLRAALADRETFVRDSPTVLKYQRDLASTQNTLGVLYNATKRPELAEKAWTDAMATLRALARAQPNVANFQHVLALTLMNLGVLNDATGRRGPSEAYHEEAIEILSALARQYPAVILYQSHLVTAQNNLGDLYRHISLFDQAEAVTRTALVAAESLSRNHPELSESVRCLAMSLGNLGLSLAENRPREAAEALTRAIAMLDGGRDKVPLGPAEQSLLPDYYRSRGRTLARLGTYTEAVADWNRAAELSDEQGGLRLRLDRAMELARAGERQRTATEARAIATIASDDPIVHYKLACLFARISIPDRAMQSLQQAEGCGLHDIRLFREDTALDPMRSRPDFHLLMMDVVFPADVFAR